MGNGNILPYVSEDHVREVLERFIQVSPQKLPPNPLQFLLLVDLYLISRADLPLASDRRQFALEEVFTDLVIAQYTHHRFVLGLNSPQSKSNLEECYANITVECQFNSVELLCWSWLYHHYLRSDLAFSREDYCKIVSIDERTLRRYQRQGIRELTQHIVRLEAQARREQRQRLLYAEIPQFAMIPLIGRDDELSRAETLLQNPYSSCIQITGASGIGKTSFVGAIVKKRIDDDLIDHVVWINSPNSPDVIKRYLVEKLLSDLPHLSLKEYCLLLRVTIVIEDIEITPDEGSWGLLLEELRGACVVITSRVYQPLAHCSHITLGELSKAAMFTLLERVNGQKSLEADLVSIWETAGGNPTVALLLMCGELCVSPKDVTLNGLFLDLYVKIPFELKQCWVLFALLPQKPIQIADLIRLWPNYLNQRLIGQLLIHHLIYEGRKDGKLAYILTPSARCFIASLAQSDVEAQKIVLELINYLTTLENMPEAPELVEAVLSCEWVKIPEELRQHWITSFWRVGLIQGHCALWCQMLTPYVQQASMYLLELHIAYGICLRYLSEWQKSHEVFSEAAKKAGRLGLFRDQARIFIEWAILFRHQGQYTNAFIFLDRAAQVLSDHYDADLVDNLYTEQAQVALEAGDIQVAEGLLARLVYTERTALLWCDLYFLKGDFARLEHLAYRIIPSLREKGGSPLAHLYDLLGKSSEKQGDFQNSYHHFSTALTLLEKQDRDYLALMRVQANLGGVLVRLEKYQEAHDLLSRVQQSQIDLQDHIGLIITRHNIQFLNQRFVR